MPALGFSITEEKLNEHIKEKVLPALPHVLKLELSIHEGYAVVDADLYLKDYNIAKNRKFHPDDLDFQVKLVLEGIKGEHIKFRIEDFTPHVQKKGITLVKFLHSIGNFVERSFFSELTEELNMFQTDSEYKYFYILIPDLLADIPQRLRPRFHSLELKPSLIILHCDCTRVKYIFFYLMSLMPGQIWERYPKRQKRRKP